MFDLIKMLFLILSANICLLPKYFDYVFVCEIIICIKVLQKIVPVSGLVLVDKLFILKTFPTVIITGIQIID